MSSKTFTIDGNNFSDMPGFYNEVEKVLTKDLNWKIGRNLNAFNDVLWGGFGRFENEESIILIWKNSEKSRKELGVANDGESFFEILTGYIKKKPHIQLIMQ